jgi:uncharacterized glyoxalase superfamily protein PhnB
MLRRILLYLSAAGWARALMSRFFLARRVARRFVAGETMQDALDVTRRLNDDGLHVTLDYLGESVAKAEDTVDVVETYLSLIAAIKRERLRSSVSLKLTHLGLDIGEDLCINNIRRILQAAKEAGVQVTIDMESSAYTEKTIDLYRMLRDEYGYTVSGAWQIAVRVHQSGGFTRDFIYLRGLIELLALLQKGVALDSLYIGKIAQKHIPIIQELRYRRILRDPPLKPRVLEDSAAQERLAALRNGIDLTEMVCPEAG